jgi:serine/threonine-protein kinase
MRICPRCRVASGDDAPTCPTDGAARLPLSSADPPCGTVVADRFLVLGPLGRGGMGVVYRAWQLSTERPVALKLLPPDAAGDPQAMARFLREAKVTASLRSPHTVTVHDFGRLPDDSLYFAMELVEGRTLARTIAEEGRLSPGRALEIVIQICLSLEEAHARGLVHRDLKPANVMVTPIGAGREFAKVLDFGIVKTPGAELTAPNTNPGTPAYMAPEQIKAGAVGPATDLYAVGVILFELLAGRRPFEADSSVALMMRHLQEPPPRLGDVAPDLRALPALESIVQRCLAKDPAARPSSAAALRAELEHAAHGRPVLTADGGTDSGLDPTQDGAAPPSLPGPPSGLEPTQDGTPAPTAPEKKGLRQAVLQLRAMGCSLQLAVTVGALLLVVGPLALRNARLPGGAEVPPPAIEATAPAPAPTAKEAPASTVTAPAPEPLAKEAPAPTVTAPASAAVAAAAPSAASVTPPAHVAVAGASPRHAAKGPPDRDGADDVTPKIAAAEATLPDATGTGQGYGAGARVPRVTAATVAALLRPHAAELHRCGAPHLVVELDFAPDGALTAAHAVDGLPDASPAFECVRAVLRRLHAPGPAAHLRVPLDP